MPFNACFAGLLMRGYGGVSVFLAKFTDNGSIIVGCFLSCIYNFIIWFVFDEKAAYIDSKCFQV